MRVCYHCLKAISSREGYQLFIVVNVDENDEVKSRCDWCNECGFDELYEVSKEE